MLGDSGFEKRLRDNIHRLDERIESERMLTNEKFAHVKSVSEGNDRRYKERFDAQESANKYSQEKANEFRGSLDDVGKKQMPRTEAEAEFKSIKEHFELAVKGNSDKIEELRARMDRNEGRNIVSDPMNNQLIQEVRSLLASRSEGSGEKSGKLSQQQFFALLVSLILAALTIGSVVVGATIFIVTKR